MKRKVFHISHMFRPFVDITWIEMKARIYVMGRQKGNEEIESMKLAFMKGNL